MRALELQAVGIENLKLVERDVPEPGPVDFRVSIFIERALNRRKT